MDPKVHCDSEPDGERVCGMELISCDREWEGTCLAIVGGQFEPVA